MDEKKSNLGWFEVNSISWFSIAFFPWSFVFFLGLCSIKLSGQESCLVSWSYLFNLILIERFIVILSSPLLLCPMPTAGGPSLFQSEV